LTNDTPSYPLCRTPACRTTKTPGYADRGLCQYHETAGLEAIEALPGDWADLQPLVWDKADLGMTDGGLVPFGPTLPIDLAADALARELAYTAVVWEIAVRERAGLSDSIGQDVMPGGPELAAAARTLAAHYSVLLALGPVDHETYDRHEATADGVDAVINLTGLHKKARAHIGADARTTNVAGVCPNCGAEELRHRDGGDVRCARCRTCWSYEAYLDYIVIVPLAAV